jgi:hypothetical protein
MKGLTIVEHLCLLVRQLLRERSSLVRRQCAGAGSGAAAPGQQGQKGNYVSYSHRSSVVQMPLTLSMSRRSQRPPAHNLKVS